MMSQEQIVRWAQEANAILGEHADLTHFKVPDSVRMAWMVVKLADEVARWKSGYEQMDLLCSKTMTSLENSAAENARLRADLQTAAERIAAQSELLSHRATVPPPSQGILR